MRAAIDHAGFVRSTGNTVWWGSDEPRVELFQPGALGWQADLQQLSDVMRSQVTGDSMRTTTNAGAITGADFVLDCTGRAGMIAKEKGLREYDDGPKTVALVGEWRTGSSWSVPDDSHTVIESYRDGWIWSVPIVSGIRHVSAMVDPKRSVLARGGASRDVYLAEIAKSKQFKRLLGDASFVNGPWGWDATPYSSREYAGDNWLLVGDAASFIDPLSSAGVKKALASAWLAAVVVRTCIEKPELKSHALAFYSRREREIERAYSGAARLFLSEAASGHREAFWADRVSDVSPASDDSAAVLAAFAQLKNARTMRLTRSQRISIEPRAYVEGHEIALGPHVVTSQTDAGTRYLYNIDVPLLLELAPTANQVPELLGAYERRRGRVDLHDFLMALSSAVARGWLVSE